jgi:ankyrin repeat protein
MTADCQEQEPSPTRSLLTGLLSIADFAALVFGLMMLLCLAGETSPEYKQWISIRIFVCGGIAMPIMLLLFVGTLIVAVCAKRLTRGFRLFMIACIAIGLTADLMALGHVFSGPYRHRQEFANGSLVYTSGLHGAVEKGDTAKAKAILDSDPKMAQALLREGDYERLEPLHIAILRKDLPMVELLLSYKIKDGFCSEIVNSGQRSGQKPLHYAAIAGNAEIVALLLDHGARINAEDDEHKTALVYAQESGNQEIVDILAKRGGARVDYEREAMEAIERDDGSRLEELLAQKLLDSKAPDAQLLHCAAGAGNVAIAQMLLLQGAKIDAMGNEGTPLHYAANRRQVEMVRFLVSKGANPNAKDKWGVEPLGWAVSGDKTEVVRVLLELGANPNTLASTDGQSCLSIAEKRKNSEIAELLRAHGARE